MGRGSRAIAAAGLALALGAAQPCDCGAPAAADAPSIETARAFAGNVAKLARRYGLDETHLANATESTTPEIAHLATGARCRFWYGVGEVSSPFFTADHTECRTDWGWFWVATAIDRRSAPPKIGLDHYWSYLLKSGGSAEEMVREKAERLLRETPGEGSLEGPEARTWAGRDRRRIDYVIARTLTPGGAPKGTKGLRFTRYSLAVVGDWIFVQTVNAPVHYRRSVETMADDAFARLLASVADAGKVAG
jgi:hypothetical protein